MTKAELQMHLAAIPNDEELFLLRASDRLAPGLVRYWAGAAQSRGASPAKVQEAKDCAARMQQWPRRKFPD